MSIGMPNTGKKKSIPKVTDVKADDGLPLLYKKVGNNHNYPFMWADKVSITAGTEVVVASGVSFHGFDLATYGNVIATPTSDLGAVTFYIDKNVGTNEVKLIASGSVTATFDVQIVLGEVATTRYIENIYSHGTNSVTPTGSY